jgi:hypothetical protein
MRQWGRNELRKSQNWRTLLLHAPYAGMTQIRFVGYFSVCVAADTPGELRSVTGLTYRLMLVTELFFGLAL